MKIKLLLLTAACVGMIACSKDATESQGAPDAGNKQIVLKISLPAGTRAFTPDAPYVEDGTTIQSLDVYFTNSIGTIQAAHRLIDTSEGVGDLTNVTTDGLRFTNLKNVSRVYCVANLRENGTANNNGASCGLTEANYALLSVNTNISNFSTYLRSMSHSLDQNAMVFAGADYDITPIKPDTNVEPDKYEDFSDNEYPWKEGDQAYTAIIKIRPLISRIEWGDINIKEDGQETITRNGTQYRITWTGWKPTLTGIYMSNVHIYEQIFSSTPLGANGYPYFFATPDYMTGTLTHGQWVWPGNDGTPKVGETNWPYVNAVMAHTGYDNGYKALIADLAAYNQSNQCVPFHFIVPFDPNSEAVSDPNSNNNVMAYTPEWHFEFVYPDQTNGGDDPYTITVEEKVGDDWVERDIDTDDDALSIASEFMYPSNTTDNLAYANVVTLYNGEASVDEDNTLIYQPGKIYRTDVTIAPYNISAGFKYLENYNVIVKVSVVDFATQAVEPEFDKNL